MTALLTIRLHPGDNVIVARMDILPGTRVEGEVVAATRVPPGHKILTRAVKKGEALRKYNQIIGFATEDMAPGAHIHTHNCVMGDFERDYAFCADAHPTDYLVPPAPFQGYRRADGRWTTVDDRAFPVLDDAGRTVRIIGSTARLRLSEIAGREHVITSNEIFDLAPFPQRLLVVGGAGSLYVAPGLQLIDTPDFPAEYKEGAEGARQALNLLKTETALAWSFISPPALLQPGARSGQFRIGGDQLLMNGDAPAQISVADLAVAIIDELERPHHLRQRFTVGY